MLRTEFLLAKIGLDTAENEPSEVSQNSGVRNCNVRGYSSSYLPDLTGYAGGWRVQQYYTTSLRGCRSSKNRLLSIGTYSFELVIIFSLFLNSIFYMVPTPISMTNGSFKSAYRYLQNTRHSVAIRAHILCLDLAEHAFLGGKGGWVGSSALFRLLSAGMACCVSGDLFRVTNISSW